MSKIIVVSNQKGGVGKTTTVINLAYELTKLNKKVLIIDLDPQGNCGSGLALELEEGKNLYEALSDNINIEKIIYPTKFDNLFLIPGSEDLAAAEIELSQIDEPEKLLRYELSQIKDQFDYIFIDTPPSLGMLTINALVASKSVLIPIQCEYYALEGISLLLKNIHRIKSNFNPALVIEGIILTMYDNRTNLSRDVANHVRKHFPDNTYEVKIMRNIKVSESPSYGLPVGQYAFDSIGAETYRKLAQEFLDNNEK